jgi:hypothetical protein
MRVTHCKLSLLNSEGQFIEETIIGQEHYAIASPGCEYKIQVQVFRDPITECFLGQKLGVRL